MTFMDFMEVVSRFQYRPQDLKGDRCLCKCPCHNDKKASLSITQTGDKILLNCLAGCDTQTIVETIGLKMSDLFTNVTVPKKPASWVEKLENWKQKKVKDIYHYKSEDNQYLYTKVRFEDKEMLFGVLDPTQDRFQVGLKNVKKRVLYHLPNLVAAIKQGETIYYVEGEKDVLTLKRLGLTATTAGGVNNWKAEHAKYFTGADVVILPDNDRAGKDLAERVKQDIKKVAKSIKIVLTSQVEKGDVTDYIEEGHTKEELIALVKNTKMVEKSPKPIDKSEFHKYGKNGTLIGVYDAVIMRYIVSNFHLFVLGSTAYLYKEGAYTRDNNGSILKSKIQELIYDEVLSIRTINRIYELVLIQPMIQRDSSELNSYPDHWINFKNGMLDVKTGELLPHSPDYYSINQIPHEYKQISETQLFRYPNLKYFLSSSLDEADTKTIFQFFGLCMTHNIDHQFFLLLLGEGGNGKSLIIALMESIVGMENTSNASLADLAGNRFSTSQLFGKLVNTCADLSKVSIDDDAEIKKITGGDRVQCEFKGKDAFSFTPYAKLFFSANRFPHVDDKSEGFKRRLRIVSMNKKPEKKDIRLKQKLLKEKEMLIAMSVQAYKEVLETGEVHESEESKRLKEESSKKSDSVFAFITDCLLLKEGQNIKRSEAFKEYKGYCEYFDRKALGKKAFFDEMKAKGFMTKRIDKDGHVYCNYVIKIWEDEKQNTLF